jgi:hypothetical protein
MSTEITINQDIVEINVTEEVVVIEAPSGAYPLPSMVSSVFGRTGNVVAQEGDYTLTQLGDVTISTPSNGQVLRYNGTTWVNATESFAGTVTSVDMSVPTGLTISGNPITTSGTLAVGLGAGYVIPTQAALDAKQDDLNGTGIVKSTAGTITYLSDNTANWNTAYNDSIVSASVTGTATKTLTLNQQDGGSVTASWTDTDTGLTSVGLSMPSAFSVANSPLTANGTLSVTGAGTTAQYVRGDGSLATFPSLTGFVPYTGATTNVNLGTHTLSAYNLIINHTSGSGVAASITKGGSGEALTVIKTSGSGNAASITGGVTLLDELHLTTDLADAYIASAATWNAKQNAITLTTTGTSGAATLVGATLNIPQYQGVLTNPVTGTGTTNTLPKFTGASTIGNSNITDDGSLITLGSNARINGLLGVGAGPLTGYAIRISKDITGLASSYVIMNDGTVLSDVTSNAYYYRSIASTQAATFTLNFLHHNFASQGTFGAGSTVTNQFGFHAASSLIGATNNFGFYGNIPSGTNRWNLYMNGTAANYLAGSLAIGTTTISSKLSVITAAGGNTSGFSVGSTNGLLNIWGGASSGVVFDITNGTLNGATGTDLLFRQGGTTGMVFAASGSLGIGSTTLTGFNLRMQKSITGATGAYGMEISSAVASDVTNFAVIYNSAPTTQAASFTLPNVYHFFANNVITGAGSTVTNQYGFFANSVMTSATNNFGFYGNIPSGTNRWNLYMNGTAANYLAGVLNIGTTTLSGFSLDVNGTARVQDNITISKNANAQTRLDINNTTSGALSVSGIQITSDATSGQFSVVKYSTATTSYKTLASRDAIIFNNSTAGNISILNDFASGNINFAAGGSSTAQLTIASTGASTFTNSVTAASFIPTSSTIPTNGMYLSGTNTLGFATNGTLDMVINEAGNVAIGTNANSAINLLVDKNITGATIAYGIFSGGTIQSGVTSQARLFQTNARTAAATFTLTNLIHYFANQETFGSGSTVTVQTGFFVEGNFSGATINRGFRGLVPASANNWNLFMDGTANNYLAGSLGIGTTSLTGINFYINKNITGSTNGGNLYSTGTIQSDMTGNINMVYSAAAVAAGAFTVSNLWHYNSDQLSIGAGAAITTQVGFRANNTLVGAGTNYGFQGRIPAGTNRWNIYMDGTANNFMAGNLGIGATSLVGRSLSVTKNITGAVTSYGIISNGQIQSDATSSVRLFNSVANTVAASFTLSSLVHYYTEQVTFGAGSTVTNQYGFYAESNLTGATNNYGFFGNIPSGTNRWNLYMAGNAYNYLGGRLGIGQTSATSTNLVVNLPITGGAGSNAIYQFGTVQSDVLSSAYGFRNLLNTAAASFTLPIYNHYAAQGGGTIGAGSVVTNQIGFNVESNMVGATNNYGFYGSLASATNTWNLYMAGTANNYLAGNLFVGITSGTAWVDIGAGTTAKAQINLSSSTAPTSPQDGDIWFDGTALRIRIGGVTRTVTVT